MNIDEKAVRQMELEKARQTFNRENEAILAKCGKMQLDGIPSGKQADEIAKIEGEFRRLVRAECGRHTIPVMGGFALRCFECPYRADGGQKLIDGTSPCSHIADWVKVTRAYYQAMIAVQAAKTDLADVERAIKENEERILSALKERRKRAKDDIDRQSKALDEAKVALDKVNAEF